MDTMNNSRIAGFAAVLTAALISAAACRTRDASASLPPRASLPAGGGVVDSAIAPAEALKRFRAGLDPVAGFDRNAARSRDLLVARFLDAVAARDTAALRRLRLSRAEFAYLYYPSTQYTRPPYETAPDILWQLMSERSASGMRRAVARVGGGPIRLVGYACEPEPKLEGRNRFFERCRLRYQRAGADSIEQRRLFGSIIARDGRYKFVSYANDF